MLLLFLLGYSVKHVVDNGYDLWAENYKTKSQEIPTEIFLTGYSGYKLC